jgi:hypothetical protein
MAYNQDYQALQDAYDDEIVKANQNVTLTNKPGKTAPRWYAALRNLGKASVMAQTLNYPIEPIIEKAHEAFDYLQRNSQ